MRLSVLGGGLLAVVLTAGHATGFPHDLPPGPPEQAAPVPQVETSTPLRRSSEVQIPPCCKACPVPFVDPKQRRPAPQSTWRTP